jgi:hypothetical protein
LVLWQALGTMTLKILLLLPLLFAVPAFANNVYVAQNAAGSANGSSCGNAYSVATLNGGWSGKINPGDTLFVCGSVSSQLQILGSGAAGNLITVTADIPSGGKFSAASWPSPAIHYVGDLAYVRLTGLSITVPNPTATQNAGNAILMDGSCDHCRIDNNIIGPFAKRVGGETCPDNTCGGIMGLRVDVNITSAVATNFEVDHNTFTQWGQAANFLFSNGATNWSFHHNICHQVGSCIWVAGTTGQTIDGVKIYNNEVNDLSPFYDSADNIHCDGLLHSHAAGGGKVLNLQVYNNYMHGSTCSSGTTSHTTTWIFIENNPPGGGNYIPSPLVYNNLIYTYGSNAGVTDGNIFFKYTYNGGAYNNTIKPGGGSSFSIGTGINLQGVTGQTLENNIVDNPTYWAVCVATCEGSGTTGVVADHNIFYASSTEVAAGTGGLNTNPLLNSDGTLQASSPAIDAGVNDSTGCPGCTIDKSSLSRPQGNGYDMGAYEYTLNAQTPPQAPSNLQAAVN